MIALLVTQGSLILVDPDGGASALNLFWSLLPLVPAAWLIWVVRRSLGRADEYQRVVQLEALAIGFATVMMVVFAGGLLDAAGIGDARQSLQVAFVVGIVTWFTALAVKTRRDA